MILIIITQITYRRTITANNIRQTRQKHNKIKNTQRMKPMKIKSTNSRNTEFQLKELHLNLDLVTNQQLRRMKKYSNLPVDSQEDTKHTLKLPKLSSINNKRDSFSMQKQNNNTLINNISNVNSSRLYRNKEQDRISNLVFPIKISPIANLSSSKPSFPQPSVQLSQVCRSPKQKYIQRLTKIRKQGTQLQKSTNLIISRARKANCSISKRYSRLRQCSNSIITGIENYCLEEERTKKYKNQVRDMWMKYNK